MKKLILIAVIIVSCLTFKNASAQIHFSVGVNIGSQPEWGPVGYDRVAYYYMPDIDGYYDVNAHQYIYLDGGVWVHRTYLPYRYRNYDLYHGYKVVVNDRDPWMRNNVYRARYAGYRGRRDQVVIRDSHDDRYRNHWRGHEDNHWGGDHGNHGGDRGDRGGDHHDNGRHEGDHHGRGHDH